MSIEIETLQQNTERMTTVMDNYLNVVRDSLSGVTDKVSRIAENLHGSGESTIPTSQCMFSEESQELLHEIKTSQTENFGLILSKLDEIYQILNNSSDNGISSITDYLISNDEKDYLIQSAMNQMLADESLSSFTNDISSLIEADIDNRNNLINRIPTEYDFSNDFEVIDSIDEFINLLDNNDHSNTTFSLKRDNSSPIDSGFSFGSYLRIQLENTLKDINNAQNNPPSGVYIEYEEAFQHNYCKNTRAIINKQRQISEIIDRVVQKLKDQSDPFYLIGFILGFTKNNSKCNKYKKIYNHVQKGNASITTDSEKQEEFELKYFSTDFILKILNGTISIPLSKSLVDYSRVKNTVNIVPILESTLATIDNEDSKTADIIRKMTMQAKDGLVMSKDNFDKIILAEILSSSISMPRDDTTAQAWLLMLIPLTFIMVLCIAVGAGAIAGGLFVVGVIILISSLIAICTDEVRDPKRKAFNITADIFDNIKEIILSIEHLTELSSQKFISALYEDINAHHGLLIEGAEWEPYYAFGARVNLWTLNGVISYDPNKLEQGGAVYREYKIVNDEKVYTGRYSNSEDGSSPYTTLPATATFNLPEVVGTTMTINGQERTIKGWADSNGNKYTTTITIPYASFNLDEDKPTVVDLELDF